MKATGIVRRMDELGRIVIPREIRKNLRIRHGEPMEIYTTSEGEVVFRKYSPFASLPQVVSDMVAQLHQVSRCNVVACDREKVIAAAGPDKIDWLNIDVPAAWQTAMEARKSAEVEGWRLVPIMDDGDVPGCLAFEASTPYPDAAGQLARFCADLISKVLEV